MSCDYKLYIIQCNAQKGTYNKSGFSLEGHHQIAIFNARCYLILKLLEMEVSICHYEQN